MIIHMKFIGSAIIIFCTTLIGCDVANSKKDRADRYKQIADYLQLIVEKLMLGNASVTDIMNDCIKNFSGILHSAADEFVKSLKQSDNISMTETFEIFIKNNPNYISTPESEYLGEFAKIWDTSGIDGIESIAGLTDKAKQKYNEHTYNLKNEIKLFVCSGCFAGIILVLLLI